MQNLPGNPHQSAKYLHQTPNNRKIHKGQSAFQGPGDNAGASGAGNVGMVAAGAPGKPQANMNKLPNQIQN